MSFIGKKKLTDIPGVGLKVVSQIYSNIGINLKRKNVIFKSKQQKEYSKITKRMSYSNTLKTKVKRAIAFYVDVRTYRGTRHFYKRPVRGQRTRTNAKTARKLKRKYVRN